MSSIRQRVWSALGLRSGVEQGLEDFEQLRPLTEQFNVTLRAAAMRVPPDAGRPDSVNRHLAAFIDRPASERTWVEAYEMEQLLVHLYDEATLRTELGCRLVEGRGILRPAASAWYLEQVGRASDAPAQRALLARLVNDLQWRYTVNELKRQYVKVITRKTGIVFAVALLVFAGALGARAAGYLDRTHVDALWQVAGAAGLWGASFSLLTSLKARLDAAELDDLKIMRYYGAIVTRALVGTGGALILYFFLRSGMLGGSVFPHLRADAEPTGKMLALLVVWCFLAGFSEKLVPGLLTQTETRADGAPATARTSPASELPETPPRPSRPPEPEEPTGSGPVVAPAPATG